jgi:hypothetical protein
MIYLMTLRKEVAMVSCEEPFFHSLLGLMKFRETSVVVVGVMAGI